MRLQTVALFALMLNRGAAGPMVYAPDFVQGKPGDTVKLLNASTGHNAATIGGMVPDGCAAFKGKINEKIKVKLDQTASMASNVRRIPVWAW